MKRLMKYCGYLSVSLLVVGCLYLMNLFSKTLLFGSFLAKELIVSMTESPEYMTYLGLFDNFDFVTSTIKNSLFHRPSKAKKTMKII